MANRILVTPRSITSNGHPALERLTQAGFEVLFCTSGRQPDEDELIRLLPGCVGCLAGVERISARALEAAGDLRVISRNGTGIDSIDLEAAQRLGIRVCRAEGANARGVAELTIALVLSLARSIPFSDHAMKIGLWERRKGVELVNRTLGLIGCGRIGRLVAEMATGLGMKIVAFDLFPDQSFHPSDRFRFGSIDEVLAQADFLSLHCPPPSDGLPVINSAALAKMKRGANLINTARANLIDVPAVAAALDDGRLGGVAFDVFETEPPRNNPLLDHNRVVNTPHIGAFTAESVDRAVVVAVDNLLEHLETVTQNG